jgi:hypothetical protein
MGWIEKLDDPKSLDCLNPDCGWMALDRLDRNPGWSKRDARD